MTGLLRSFCVVFTVGCLLDLAAFGESEASLDCTNYISVIADSGLVISEMNADEPHAPASMVKMILMLMVSEGLETGKWTPETQIPVTKEIEAIGGTQVYLKAGETWPLEPLMEGIAVASANDAAAAVAEGLWGSREAYLEAANARARELGMLDTEVNSPNGLPPEAGQKPDVTTARDMAILARACVNKPQIMKWVGLKELQFRPGDQVKTTTNKLMERMPECDGLKTGYTRAAGFCITATAVRNDIRLIVVVMGCPKLSERFDTAQKLLEEGFAETRRERVVAKGDPIKPALPVRNAKTASVNLRADNDIWVTAKNTDFDQMEFVPHYPNVLRAPLKAGDKVGTLSVELGGRQVGEVGVIVPEDLPVPGWHWKLAHSVLNRLDGSAAAQGG